MTNGNVLSTGGIFRTSQRSSCNSNQLTALPVLLWALCAERLPRPLEKERRCVCVWTGASSRVQINTAPWEHTGVLFPTRYLYTCLLKGYFAKFERKNYPHIRSLTRYLSCRKQKSRFVAKTPRLAGQWCASRLQAFALGARRRPGEQVGAIALPDL